MTLSAHRDFKLGIHFLCKLTSLGYWTFHIQWSCPRHVSDIWSHCYTVVTVITHSGDPSASNMVFPPSSKKTCLSHRSLWYLNSNNYNHIGNTNVLKQPDFKNFVSCLSSPSPVLQEINKIPNKYICAMWFIWLKDTKMLKKFQIVAMLGHLHFRAASFFSALN